MSEIKRDMRSRIRRLLVAAIVIAILLAGSAAFPPVTAGAGATPWRFAVVTDTHVTGTTTNLLPEMAESIVNDGAKLVLFTGDNADGGSSLTRAQLENQLVNWQNAAAPLYNAGIGVYPVRGNHEASVTDSITAWNNVFSGLYALPANGPSGETNLTYSVSCNNALFIGFDEFIPGQEYMVNQAWFDSQLAGNTRPHVFTFGHTPAFKTGHSNCLGAYPDERNTFWSSFYGAGGKVYFCGHDHYLDLARIDNGDGYTGNDFYQCIVGPGCSRISGAATYEGWNNPYTPVNIFHESQNGYQLVEVSGPGNDDLNVTMTWKQRTFNPETGLYEYVATSDVLTYTASMVPHIDSVAPTNGPAGTVVTIAGTAFGSSQGTSTVTFNGTPATVTSDHWSDGVITTTVPSVAATGPVVITTAGGTSNTDKIFTVPSTFYFAEGYTGTDFAEYLCLGNPNSSAASANVTYFFSDGTTKTASYDVPATGRTTINVNSVVGPDKEVSVQILSDTSNLVAERPMYFNYNGVWTGGSDVVGATSPNANWYFAEGNTLPDFDQYVTVFNPTDSPANLTFHYMVEGHGEKDVNGSVRAHSRATFKTRDQIGSNLNASLHLSSGQNVVAERPMYFNYQGLASNNWTGGHNVIGANSPQNQWYFAEGTTRGGFEEWLCLENPGSSDITVNATYQLSSGEGDPINKSYTVSARQRLTVSVNREIGPEKDNSMFLSSNSGFIAERSMYFNYQEDWTGGSDVLGASSSANNWSFAEGTTRSNFNEYLCLQNPGNATAHATVTYYTTSGQTINKSCEVSANSRLTVNVNEDAGANLDISARVSSDNPIIVERPMYFDYNGWTGGHDVVGF